MLTIEEARLLVIQGFEQRQADIDAGRSPSFTVQSIRDIARQLPAQSSDSVDTFVFYSGGFLGDAGEQGSVSAHTAALTLRTQGAGRVGLIDDTKVARFLSDARFSAP